MRGCKEENRREARDAYFSQKYVLIMMNERGFPTLIMSNDLERLEEIITYARHDHFLLKDCKKGEILLEGR